MTQRQPGDYVVNAELTDEQRERFVQDCVAAGVDRIFQDCQSHKYTSLMRPLANLVVGTTFLEGGNHAYWKGYSKNVTHEYKGERQMPQPQLMRHIADAMERNPDGWWEHVQNQDNTGVWFDSHSPFDVFEAICDERELRPKPRTYTLHVEDVPIGEVGHSDIYRNASDRYTAVLTVDYPDEPTAREALEKLTRAMGGGNE